MNELIKALFGDPWNDEITAARIKAFEEAGARDRAKRETNPRRLYLLLFEDGLVKIGVSRNPRERMKALENQSGRTVKRFCVFDTEKPALTIEAGFKRRFKEYAVGGEYFSVPFDTAKLFLEGAMA